jgi:hypothetical protein
MGTNIFSARPPNAKPEAAMLHCQPADAQEHRNLCIGTLAQQFVVSGRPPVLLRVENGDVSGTPACGHALDASFQPPRQLSVRHGAQQFLFRPIPEASERAKWRKAQFAPALVDRSPRSPEAFGSVPIGHGAQEPVFVGRPMLRFHSHIIFPKSDLDQVRG